MFNLYKRHVDLNFLVSFIRITRAARRNPTPNDHILPEQRLAVTLRFLAGGSVLDLVRYAPIARKTVYKVVWDTMKVIAKTEALDFRSVDLTRAACADRAAAFAKRSSAPEIFKSVVGAIDGLFIRIIGRPTTEVLNADKYYSGHKKGYGVNLQVLCDAYCRILDMSIQ